MIKSRNDLAARFIRATRVRYAAQARFIREARTYVSAPAGHVHVAAAPNRCTRHCR